MVILGALPRDASHARAPQYWLEDLYWHRISSGGSEFTWTSQDAVRIFLRHARGRAEFETFDHLRALCSGQHQLAAHRKPITLVAGEMIMRARDELTHEEWWDHGLHMLSLDGMGMTELTYLAEYDSWPELPVALEHPEVRAATRGFANPNPLTKAWELIQVNSMYTAALDMFEDMICDLVVELQPDHGWITIARHLAAADAWGRTPSDARSRVEAHRERRGVPGDARRAARQDYGAPVAMPPEVARYMPVSREVVAEPFGYA